MSEIDLPPTWIVKAARVTLNKTRHWSDYLDVLCAYYQIPTVDVLSSPNDVPKGSIAVYKRGPNIKPTIYGKGKTDESVALHEFYHHLMHEKLRVVPSGPASEALADGFAEAIIQRDGATE